jgi:hypothetical protein
VKHNFLLENFEVKIKAQLNQEIKHPKKAITVENLPILKAMMQIGSNMEGNFLALSLV